MPQMSPMSWPIVFLFLFFTYITMSNLMSKPKQQNKKNLKMKELQKKMNW